jgi:fatty-acyl-CoA synthase
MKIRTQADIEKLEQVPVTERIRHASVADLLHDATREHSGRVAIRYLAGTGSADPVRDVTYDELRQRVIQAANLLHAHGIGPQDTVTLLRSPRSPIPSIISSKPRRLPPS